MRWVNAAALVGFYPAVSTKFQRQASPVNLTRSAQFRLKREPTGKPDPLPELGLSAIIDTNRAYVLNPISLQRYRLWS